MKRTIWMLTALLVICANVAWGRAKAAAWPKYEGAWFSVSYPPGFKARAGQVLSSGDGTRAQSAFFSSRDGSVEFYVFSPQWNGSPKDIALKPSEVLVSQSTQKSRGTRQSDGSYRDQITTRSFTARAKNRSYTRSWLDIENTAQNTRLAFGYKYRDQKALRKHRSEYLRFKSSLQQFADG